jgi:hypothetical protein
MYSIYVDMHRYPVFDEGCMYSIYEDMHRYPVFDEGCMYICTMYTCIDMKYLMRDVCTVYM